MSEDFRKGAIHAAALAARCKEIIFEWKNPPGRQFQATAWCNAIGQVIASDWQPTEYDAVVDVMKKVEAENGNL